MVIFTFSPHFSNICRVNLHESNPKSAFLSMIFYLFNIELDTKYLTHTLHLELNNVFETPPGSRLNTKTVFPPGSFPCMGIPILKIKRSRDRLILNMWIPILLIWQHLYIETAPRPFVKQTSVIISYSITPGNPFANPFPRIRYSTDMPDDFKNRYSGHYH